MSKPARAPYAAPATVRPVRPVRARKAPGLPWPLRPIAPTGDLPDINVWLGLVRLLCQPKAVGAGALQQDAAWALYQQYRALPQIGLASEPLDCDSPLGALLANQTLPARQWTDAYLVALARSFGLRLVTFDRDFERFDLEKLLLLPRP